MCPTTAEEYRTQFLANAELAAEASKHDPLDAQKLKKWGFALMELTTAKGEEDRYLEFLHGAKEKLEKSLEINSTDHEAMLYLGQVHLAILTLDRSMDLYDEDYTTHCGVAVKCFITVRDEAPELYEESNSMLENMVDFLPNTWFSPPESPEMEYTELDEKEGEAMILLGFQQDRRAAEIEYSKNPDNADNLRKWGIALIELTWYLDSQIEKRKFINDAIAKFSKALTLKPDDVETKLELVKARLLIVNPKEDEGAEYEKLLEEHKLLGGEVNYCEKVPPVKIKEAYELCKEYLEQKHDLALEAARKENKRKIEC